MVVVVVVVSNEGHVPFAYDSESEVVAVPYTVPSVLRPLQNTPVEVCHTVKPTQVDRALHWLAHVGSIEGSCNVAATAKSWADDNANVENTRPTDCPCTWPANTKRNESTAELVRGPSSRLICTYPWAYDELTGDPVPRSSRPVQRNELPRSSTTNPRQPA